MKKPGRPRHQRAVMRFASANGSAERIALIEVTERLIIQFVEMAKSDDPGLRSIGRERIRVVAEACVAGQFFLSDQKTKTGKERGTIEADDGRTSATAIIRTLARQRDALGDYLKPKEIWPQFVAALDRLGLRPKEDKIECQFEGGTITKNAFRMILNRARKTKSAT